MLPTREEALKLIRDGLLFNPGPWGEHCLTAAHCAEKIASASQVFGEVKQKVYFCPFLSSQNFMERVLEEKS